ncbi:hypothetical protein PthBH41_31380 [Parageobacillus thermoglucosidasius]|nr:hypothetical protein PthBH41_31380 [Parageobacillus thermoglucosidasius]
MSITIYTKTKGRLFIHKWDGTEFVDDNTLSVNITRVRKKRQQIGIKQAIETVRGVGYKLALDTLSLLGGNVNDISTVRPS